VPDSDAMAGTDRVVLITGATGGLGRVAAASLASDGARLILGSTERDELEALASEIGLAEDRWTPLAADLRDEAATRSAVADAERRFGPVDILIHLVGGFASGTPIVELDHSDLQSMFDQHLGTAFHVVKTVVPGMVERGWGRVVAISAPVTATTPPRTAPYAIGKAALETLFRTLAREVAASGVTVNLLQVKAIDLKGERLTDPKKASWTTPDEIVGTIRFLCSDDAAAINGAKIPLDGR
jgi:NAD(P)-dependent dehydrogenase (short-subunit alcohol dehydrogenase family)